jgi:hypothetical protein
MVFNAKIPYNDLPPLPPEVDVETKTILKETIAAKKCVGGIERPRRDDSQSGPAGGLPDLAGSEGQF